MGTDLPVFFVYLRQKIRAGNCIVGVPFLWNYIAGVKKAGYPAFQTVKKLIHCEREGSGGQDPPEFIPQAEFISAEENPVFLRPDKVQGFSQK